jgi:hypothetical protein
MAVIVVTQSCCSENEVLDTKTLGDAAEIIVMAMSV